MDFINKPKNSNAPFWVISISVVLALVLPSVMRQGMFMDGVLYSSVSNNLARGYGSMWFLKFSEYSIAGTPTFHEQPHLFFWIQSIFFKLFGEGIYVEKMYSLLTAFITVGLISKVWKIILPETDKIRNLNWLPVVFWITIPVAFWSFNNNVIENTMGIFVLLSFIFLIKAIHLKKHIFSNLILAGVFIFLASFSKGVPGLFTIGVPFIYWLVFRNYSIVKMIIYCLIPILVVGVIYLLILLIPEANDSLSIYFFKRLLGRTANAPTVSYRAWVLVRLIQELIPAYILLGIVIITLRVKKVKLILSKKTNRFFLFYLLVGLSGSLPLMFTMVQKAFYFSASLPFFGLAFSSLIAPGMNEWISTLSNNAKTYTRLKYFSIVLFILTIGISFTQFGKYNRHQKLLEDVKLLGNYLTKKDQTIIIENKMWNEWDLQTYMMRYYHISFATHDKPEYRYYLLDKKLNIKPDSNYTKVNLPLTIYELYEKNR